MIDKKARDYLLAIPLWTKKKNTLDEVRHFLEELGNPDEQLRIIHVAGTNGKGSVCADLTAMLMEAGYHVGTFVSPHLTDVTERFLVDGIPVEEAGFSESFFLCVSASYRRDRAFSGGWHPCGRSRIFRELLPLCLRILPT